MNSNDREAIIRSVALVLWADGRLLEEEFDGARSLFEDLGLNWAEAKKVLFEFLEDLIDPVDEAIEEDCPIKITPMALEEISPVELIARLAVLACSDEQLTIDEVDILHHVGTALDCDSRIVTAGILRAIESSSKKIQLAI